jgi:hypothetical protein
MRLGRAIGLEASVVGALVVATMLFILIGVGLVSWPVLLGWSVGWAVVGGVVRALLRFPVVRLAFALVLVPLFVLLTFEGGLLMLPALLALVVFEATGLSQRRQTAGTRRGGATPSAPLGA